MSLRAQNPDVVGAVMKDGTEVRLRLFGVSMKPLFRDGALLRFSGTATPRLGDVVLLRFQNGDAEKLVAHRVRALDATRVWTKGDASRSMDPPTERSRVLGTATALDTARGSIPLRGWLMRAFGLVLGSSYPLLARTYRVVFPRREKAHPCAS